MTIFKIFQVWGVWEEEWEMMMMETLFCNLLSKFKQLKGGSVPDAGAGGSLACRALATSRFDATSRVVRVFCGIWRRVGRKVRTMQVLGGEIVI